MAPVRAQGDNYKGEAESPSAERARAPRGGASTESGATTARGLDVHHLVERAIWISAFSLDVFERGVFAGQNLLPRIKHFDQLPRDPYESRQPDASIRL